MSFNLMDLAKGAINQGVMGKLGGLLGSDEKGAGGAVSAALPALIGGLMKKSSSSAGANEVFGQLDKFDGGMLENLGGIFDGGKKQSGMLDMGGGIMKMIFGDKVAGIIGMISKVTGLGGGSITKLLGVLAPIVMSVLGKQKKSAGWDIGNFTSAMSDQKQHMAGVDSGMLSSLGLGDIMGSGKEMAGKAMGAVTGGVGDATKAIGGGIDKAGDMANQAAGGLGNLVKIGLPILALAILGYIGCTMFGGGDKEEEKKAPPIPNTQALDEGDTPLDKFNGMLSGVTDSLGNVTDAASATTAAGKLKDVTSGFDSMGIGNLPGPAKKLAVITFRGKLDGILEKLYVIPGVKSILEPVIEGLLGKLGG